MMTSPIHSENGDSYDKPYHGNSKRHGSLFHSGVLLLEDAERAPEYLRLTIDSDPDDPDEPDPIGENDTDEEDVVVLGEKRPTYQEITLEEDDEGEIREKIVEIEIPEPFPKTPEEPLYECTYCDKSFRVESLLKFHIKMHNSSVPGKSKKSSPSVSSSDLISDVDNKPKKKRHSTDDKDDNRQKTTSKTYLKQKIHREKHSSHKHKKHKGSEST